MCPKQVAKFVSTCATKQFIPLLYVRDVVPPKHVNLGERKRIQKYDLKELLVKFYTIKSQHHILMKFDIP